MTQHLAILENVSRALDEAKTLSEIKSLRDKAEAARQYARAAALGLELQNMAAEMKLRAERKAGDILAQMRLRGGSRNASARGERLTLAELGIDDNKSTRWQRAASIPEETFDRYLAISVEQRKEITTQGLLRMAKQPSQRQANSHHQQATSTFRKAVASREQVVNRTREVAPTATVQPKSSADETISELISHLQLLESLIAPVCRDQQRRLQTVAANTALRLLAEMHALLAELTLSERQQSQ